MQLMCDALAVLGSRHGLVVDPINHHCGLVRFGFFEMPPVVEIKAGAVIDGIEYTLPLAPAGAPFDFLDQRMTPCTISIMGIHGKSAVKVKLTIATPLRFRDADFSTTPVLALKVEATQMPGQYRWTGKETKLSSVQVFLEVGGPDFAVEEASGDALDLVFTSHKFMRHIQYNTNRIVTEDIDQRDRLVAVAGALQGRRFVQTVDLAAESSDPLVIAWCTHSAPALEIHGTKHPFRYASRFANLAAVEAWARAQTGLIFDNAARVDGIVGRNRCSAATNHLLAQSLHSWLINTWWVDRDGRDFFSVWEGTCYFQSTVDVEYTQSPFYLSVWPELLEIELDYWPEFSVAGEKAIGERGKGTLFLAHDVGKGCKVGAQEYGHYMAVEETTNYLIMLCAFSRRTGSDTLVRAKVDIVRKYLSFLEACDTDGSGVPDLGVANTIDDAAPAIQFGREQTYLAVKTVAAYLAGADLLETLGDSARAERCRELADRARNRVEEKGWLGDHYAVLLDKRGIGVTDPRTGDAFDVDELPGWDSPHIYTTNGMAVLDMVGLDLGLDRERVRRDLQTASQRCLREYGCVHLDFSNTYFVDTRLIAGLAGNALNPGWVSMNMLRDIAALYRGVDLRYLADRYWEWQVVTNTQEPKIFFETFNGNNLSFYPRGVAVWGVFEALAGQVIDRKNSIDRASSPFAGILVPRLFDADWTKGTCSMVGEKN